jgi:hypothetical protein
MNETVSTLKAPRGLSLLLSIKATTTTGSTRARGLSSTSLTSGEGYGALQPQEAVDVVFPHLGGWDDTVPSARTAPRRFAVRVSAHAA